MLIIVDAAYTIHEALLVRIEASDAALEAKGWTPGLCSNGWKITYITLSVGSVSSGRAHKQAPITVVYIKSLLSVVPLRCTSPPLQLIGSIAAIGAMYAYFGGCPLNIFYLSETIIVSTILLLASLMGQHSKGLLTPCVLLGYTTFLCFGAITNNPNPLCNQFSVTGNYRE